MSCSKPKGQKNQNKSLNLTIRTLGACLIFVLLMIVAFTGFHNLGLTAEAYLSSILSVVGATTLTLLVLRPLYRTPDFKRSKKINYLDNLSKAFVVTERSKKLIYANKIYFALTKGVAQSPIDLVGNHRELAEGLYRLGQAALQTRSTCEEFCVERSHSPFTRIADQRFSSQWIKVSVEPIANSEQILWIIEDVTTNHLEQEQSYRNLQAAIDHLDRVPVGIFALNKQNKIVFVNAYFASELGFDVSKLLALDIHDVVAREDWSIFEEAWLWPTLEDKATGDHKSPVKRVRFLTAAHQSKEFSVHVSVDTSATNDIVRLVAIPVIATQQIEPFASHTLIFNQLLNCFPVAVALLDQGGKIVALNRRFLNTLELEGRDISYLIGKDLHTFIAKSDSLKFEKQLERLQPQQNTVLETALAEQKDKHLSLYSALFNLPPAGMSGVIVVAIETTVQKALEEQVGQSQKMQAVGQLAGGIAHDFNNVLTAILMSCDLLLSSHRSSDPSHPDLINIKNNANRAASLVQQLLAFSRRQTLRPEVIDLTDLLSDIRMLLLRLLGSNVKLTVIHGRDLWKVEVDQASLQRVIMNLAINARDAMPDGGQITISTSNVDSIAASHLNYQEIESNDYVEISVADTGTGISEEVKKKMFEPFFTTKEVGKGTGLGLSMVYGIIKQTGGYIFCDSNVGVGTTFRIFLPRYIAQSRLKEKSEKLIEERAQLNLKHVNTTDLSGSATILVVEDEDAVRMGSVRALTTRGYTVLEASSGVEALEILKKHNGNIDLVVSDVVMPEMDGPTLYKELRKLYPEIRFIFVSGYARDAFADNLIDNEHFGFLAKPFSLRALATTVKEMLSRAN